MGLNWQLIVVLICISIVTNGASLETQIVKNLPVTV